MGRKNHRLLLFITTCSAVGILMGGTASRAEVEQCQTADVPSDSCLSQDPTAKIIEGMGMGLLAGSGAAVGATWHLWQQKD
jgi:hypothetical protein